MTASPDVTLQEVNEAAELIHTEAHDEANIIWGMVIDENLTDRVRVTVIATGFGDHVGAGAATAAQAGVAKSASTVMGSAAVDAPAFGRKPVATSVQSGSEVIKLKKLSVLTAGEDEDKFEIPTFLRKQAE